MVRMIEPSGPQAPQVARDDASHADADADPASDGVLEVFALPLSAGADERAARLLAEADGRRYRFLAKAIPQIVWTATPRGRVDSFNPRWGEYTGLAPDGPPDCDWVATLHPEDVRRWRVAWAQARQLGSNFSIDLRLRRKDGTFRWHLARALPVLDRPGQAIVKWLGTCTDIDDQKRAEGMLAFLAEVSTALSSSLDYETTLAAVARLAVPHVADWCVVDIAEPDGSIRRLAVAHADPARVELGWKLGAEHPPRPDAAEGVAPVLRSGRTELVVALDAAHLDRAACSPEHRALLESLGLTSTVAAPLVARGRTIGVLTLAMAESGRAYTAADLPLVEDLARRAAMAVDNARLYREAQQARAEAEAANRAKDRFLAVLGHELRTPLTPVLAEVSELLADPNTAGAFRPVLEMTRRNVELEARLIDDLLDLSRIARGKLQIRRERVDLHVLVEQAVAICRPGIVEAGLSASVCLEAARHHVDADPAKVQQILWNLIKNATKFTSAGGSIVVRTRDLPGGAVAVEVADTGAGIAPEALGRIFAPFDQGDPSVTRRFGGLGLGLAIARSLAAAHDGRLVAASDGLGRGAMFTLELPTIDGSAPALPAPSAPENDPPAAALRILLVEDDSDTRLVLARLLARRGHRVASAGSVAEAVELAHAEPFDALVCDLGLPDGSGHDLIRQLDGRRPAVALALSGLGMVEDVERSRGSGFDDHLVKPIDFATLEATLRRLAAASSGPGRAAG